MGGFLVAGAAVLVFGVTFSSTGQRGQPYLVASRPLATGAVLGPGDVRADSMKLAVGVRSQSFAKQSTLVGRTLAVPVAAGELIESDMLSPADSPPSLRPVSVPVDPDSLAGLVAGKPVDVLATPGGQAAPGGGQVSIVVRGASVLGVNRGGSGVLSGSTSASVVTLGVPDLAAVEAVIEAAHQGTLTLIEAEPSDGVGSGPAGANPGGDNPSGAGSS